MKEIKHILAAYHLIDFAKTKAALATVVRVEGSSYRRAGARMLVTDNGDWFGGISGGCLEGDALKKARLVIAQNKASIITYDTTTDDPFQIGVGLGCNGIIDVLISPIDPQNPENAVLILERYINQRSPHVLITVVSQSINNDIPQLGSIFSLDNQFDFNDSLLSSFNKIALLAIKEVEANGRSIIKEIDLADNTPIKLFLEVIQPTCQLFLFGSNYDIYPMAFQAKALGWKVVVVCNPLKMSKQLNDLADKIIDKNQEIEIDNYSAALLMHHDYENDYQQLIKILGSNIPFIGLLGPKKRTIKMYKRMTEDGFHLSENDQNRIFSPVGLDIGAANPEEIALSACAEIKAFFSKRNGNSLKFREKGIYEE
jgi:xanthine dehydrogenase accessory factor